MEMLLRSANLMLSPLSKSRVFSASMAMHAAFDEARLENAYQIYDGAQHAFFNDGRAHSYHPEASADAWRRALGWFRQYLA